MWSRDDDSFSDLDPVAVHGDLTSYGGVLSHLGLVCERSATRCEESRHEGFLPQNLIDRHREHQISRED